MADDLVDARPSPVHGTGAFARQDIRAGTHIGTYTGLATSVDGTYVLWVETDDGSFAGIDGDGVLRWLNHSQSPNVEFDGPELYAIVDITADQELFFDYGEEWANVP